jgi:D-glucosaminate-6-phosphate ammonia-lyase
VVGIYEQFGVKPIINVSGTVTRYGGALMGDEVVAAMAEAARQSVRLDELQAAASKVIAQITHAEAGIVTNGASAALTLGTAACICGFDVVKMNRLPVTDGIPNEVIMPWHQISGYDHSIRVAGGKLIGFGIPNDTTRPHEVHKITRWDLEAAISEKTVAIAYAARLGSHPPLEDVVEVAKKYNIPVLVDAAAQIPPVENLHRFIDMGVDLVCFSGGKGIRGPQSSGILCGRRDLIASAVLQMLDMAGEPFDKWNPPPSLIPKDKLQGKPEHGVGRGMKVSKEAIIGLLVALKNLTPEGFAAKAEGLRGLLTGIGEQINDIAGVELSMSEDYKGAYPMLEVKLNQELIGKTAAQVAAELANAGIYVRDKALDQGVVIIHSLNLNAELAQYVGECLKKALSC